MFQLLWHHILSSSFLLPIFLCTRCLRWETWTLMYIVYCSLVGFSDLGLIYSV
jgi:hypothetical protein